MNEVNELAVMSVWTQSSQPKGKNNGEHHCSIEKYSTAVNRDSSLNHKAESKARDLIKQAGYSYPQELDWLALSPSNDWLCVEVKFKSRLYHPPPFWGIGLDFKQLFLRRKILELLSIRCFLMVYVKDLIYGQYLDVLEKGTQYKTEKDIVIFPLDSFLVGEEAILSVLKGGADGS